MDPSCSAASAPSEVNVEPKPIYKPKNKYNLQDAIGLKNEKQRWLTYLEIMRECLYEKNVNFDTSYRTQKHLITSQIVRAFKKKAPDFPLTGGDWAVKEMLVSTIQNKRYYLKRKKIDNLRAPLQDPSPMSPAPQDSSPPMSPASQDPSPSSPQSPRDPLPSSPQSSRDPTPSPQEPVQPLLPRNDLNGQNQGDNVPKRNVSGKQRKNNQENQNVPKKRGRKPKSR